MYLSSKYPPLAGSQIRAFSRVMSARESLDRLKYLHPAEIMAVQSPLLLLVALISIPLAFCALPDRTGCTPAEQRIVEYEAFRRGFGTAIKIMKNDAVAQGLMATYIDESGERQYRWILRDDAPPPTVFDLQPPDEIP